MNAAAVYELRTKTGLPLMACKEAMVEAGGNHERAEAILRVRLKEKMDRRSAPKDAVPPSPELKGARLFDLEWDLALLEKEIAAVMGRLTPIRDEIARRYARKDVP